MSVELKPRIESSPRAGRRYSLPAEQPAEAMMASMKLNGIERLWFVSGTEIGFFQEAAVKHQALGRPAPRIMTMTHESVALAAACGDTLITGKPSATAFHVEVGLLNAGGAIHNADRGRYPVLIMSGYPPSAEANSVPGARSSQIHWYQQIRDQGELVRQYMRWDHKLAPYDNAGLVITRAAQVMLSEPQGPAYLAVPRETAMTHTTEAQFPLLDQLRPASAPPPDRQELRTAAQWLLDAENPLICTTRTGRQRESVAALIELAEEVGARVMTDPYRMSFPGSHPLHRGSAGTSPTPADTDCILGLDSVVPWMTPNYNPGPEVRVIRIGSDPIERMTGIYEFPSDLSISGDAARAVPALLEEVRSLMTPEQKRKAEARLERNRDEGRQRITRLLDTAEKARAQGRIDPLWLSHQIGQLDPEVIVTHELCENSLFNRTEPGTLFGTGGSSIGFAAPMAVGVKVAAPDRQVVAAMGDGSWMFSNPQVVTWASMFHKAPVLFLIFNNRGYRTGTHEVLRAYPEGYAAKATDLTGGWFDPCPNYSGEAAASGCYGEKVSDPNDLAAAIQRGLDANRQGVPAVLDVWMPKLITGEV